MERNPEQREAPNSSELKPKPDRTETVRKIGREAIKGANKTK